MSPIAVNRTTKFDSGGIRLYTVNSNADVKVEFPEHIEKLLKEMSKQPQAETGKRESLT